MLNGKGLVFVVAVVDVGLAAEEPGQPGYSHTFALLNDGIDRQAAVVPGARIDLDAASVVLDKQDKRCI